LPGKARPQNDLLYVERDVKLCSLTLFHEQSRDDPIKKFRKGSLLGSCDPLNFWALNANNSKTVKATDFIFDVHVSRDGPDTTP